MRFEFSIELGGEFQLSGLKAAAKSGGEQEKPIAVLSAVTVVLQLCYETSFCLSFSKDLEAG